MNKQQEIQQLKRKIKDQQIEIEKYQISSKKLEQKLIQDSQIKKLKEQTIKKQKYCSNCTKLQQKVAELEIQIKNLTNKNTKLNQDIIQYRKNKQIGNATNRTIKVQQQQHELTKYSNLQKYCLILTKKHYTSPFLQIKNNQIKLLKNTRTGFQKSLGSTRYKFSLISYELQSIVQNIVDNINGIKQTTQNINQAKSDSVIIIGNKKTSKKYIMANVILKLKQKIMEFAQNKQCQVEIRYLIRSLDEQKNKTYESKVVQEFEQIFNTIQNMKQRKQNKTYSKNTSKPKIRYFSCKIKDYIFQIVTTSHTQIPVKDNSDLNDGLNHYIYCKMLDVLPLSFAKRQIVLTLNPIIQHYDDCKNTLSIISLKKKSQKLQQKAQNPSKQQIHNKQKQLNEIIKWKVDNLDRQKQQNYSKVKKLEDECLFYRKKFQQLEVRLKALLSIHNSQNSYLKKSPITTSYQKLLKLIHNTLGRNTNQTIKTSPNKYHQNLTNRQYQSS